jgi:prevent-host-death family protein
MHQVNVHAAKTQLSKLLERVQSGENIVIARAGTPIAQLVPYTPPKREIAPPGAMEGEIWIADDFDEPLESLFECLDTEGSD